MYIIAHPTLSFSQSRRVLLQRLDPRIGPLLVHARQVRFPPPAVLLLAAAAYIMRIAQQQRKPGVRVSRESLGLIGWIEGIGFGGRLKLGVSIANLD